MTAPDTGQAQLRPLFAPRAIAVIGASRDPAKLGAADRGAIGAVLAALGDLLVASPALEAAEINPLRVTSEGLLALDAVVTLRDREADHA